jgi:hypothetical protein
MSVEYYKTYFKNNYFTYFNRKKDFKMSKIEDFANNKCIYKIVGHMPCSYKKCLKYLSNTSVRESMSNNSFTCEIIKKINDNEWYEKMIFPSEISPTYCIDKIECNDTHVICYSETPTDYTYNMDSTYDKHNNLFTGFECVESSEKSCKVICVLVFNDIDFNQEIIVDITTQYLITLKQGLIKP